MEPLDDDKRNPIRYINLLRRYSRQDYGSIFFFLPHPCRETDEDAADWLSTLWRRGAARKRWIVSADQAADFLMTSHPHLFVPPPVCFEVYRVDRVRLNRVLATV